MAEEMRRMSREGTAPRLVEPDEMVPPLLYVVSREADAVNGYRFDANLWNAALPPAEAARRAPPASSCTRKAEPLRRHRRAGGRLVIGDAETVDPVERRDLVAFRQR